MKLNYLFFLIVLFAFTALSAQGFYFDVGGGFGRAATTWTEQELGYPMPPYSKVGIGYDVGGKIGHSPFTELPLYFVADFAWTLSSSWEYKYEYIWYSPPVYKESSELTANHMFIGPGIVYYPTTVFQFSASLGVVNTVSKQLYSYERIYPDHTEGTSSTITASNFGFGFNLSGAFDLGNKTGFLIGSKLSVIDNRVEFKDEDLYIDQKMDLSTTYVGLFVKYRIK